MNSGEVKRRERDVTLLTKGWFLCNQMSLVAEASIKQGSFVGDHGTWIHFPAAEELLCRRFMAPKVAKEAAPRRHQRVPN